VPNVAHNRSIALGAPVACGLAILAAIVGVRSQGTNATAAKPGAVDLVVVSSHDAGPGTLRDAILAADRLSSPARIVIKAKLVVVESRLPPLINPRGVQIDAAPDAGTIDADHQATGPTLEVDSAGSTLRGLHIIRAHVCGIMINAPGVQLDSLTVKDSKVGIMVNAGGPGTIVRTSLLEHDETGLLAEAGVRDVSLVSDIFRLNTRAGFWFVGATDTRGADPGHDEAGANVRVRIIDGVFEKNAIGAVLANRLSVFEKDRFIGNRDGALTILGGAARVEDSEIRGSGGAAISVTSGRSVVLARNMLVDNASAALMIRDSEILIESNTLRHNGLGIVLISSRASFTPVIKDNLITQTTADAIMLIGGASLLQHNQVIKNGGAGLRPLDIVEGKAKFKVEPRLDANVFRGNRVDVVETGVYRLSGAP
jgi:Right handed beta helix region